MAKRFTDSEKWRHPFFRRLPAEAKLAWLFLLDNCDHAGIWIIDFELASFQLGFELTVESLAKWFGEKIFPIDENRLFIPNYLEFQYGKTLDSGSKSHQSAQKILNNYNIDLQALPEPLSRSFQAPFKPLDSRPPPDMNTDTITITKKGGVGENNVPPKPPAPRFDFDAVYQVYPRREGKSVGIAKAKRDIKTPEDYAALNVAVENYRQKKAGTEAKFLKLFSTFMGEWRDWVDPAAGTAETLSKPSASGSEARKLPEPIAANPDAKALAEKFAHLSRGPSRSSA